MPTTYTSTSRSFSFGTSLTEGTEDGPTATTTTLEQQSIEIAIGTPIASDDGGGLSATAIGSATAVGTDTLAVGSVTATATTATYADIAYAEASFTALAMDESGGALATTFADVEITGAFDIVIGVSSSSSTTVTVGDASVWYEQQSIAVTGIDIGGSGASAGVGSQGADGGATIDAATEIDGAPTTVGSEADGVGSSPGDLDIDIDIDIDGGGFGNLAFVDFTALAVGEDSFADVVVSVLAVEDQLSTVDAIAIAVVGI